MTVLVTGARGHVGGAVLRELLDAGTTVRATSRSPESADLPAGVELVRADLTDPATLPTALAGVRKVFLYAQPDGVGAFVDAAKAAGVEHVVLLSSSSVVTADADTHPIAQRHALVERALVGSGIDWTFVRPGAFATNSLQWAGQIRSGRVLRTAFPQAHSASVHERDIAAVVAGALLDDAHRQASYLISGPASLTQEQQVARLAEAIGEPIRIEVISREEQRAGMARFMPADIVNVLLAYQEESEGKPADVFDGVQQVTGRPAISFADWAKDHADDFR